MACARCEERRRAFARAREAAGRRDHEAARAEMEFIARTSAQDLAAALKSYTFFKPLPLVGPRRNKAPGE